MMNTGDDFCHDLVDRFPELRPLLLEHLSDYDELLPYVFIADVTRYLLADPPSRADIVQFLEHSFATEDCHIQDLIALSFVENIDDHDDFDRVLGGVDAPDLRAEWHQQHGHNGGN